MQHARVRLYHTADKLRLVGEGHPAAAFLYAAIGDEIPDSAAERFGIVDGALKPARKADPLESLLGSSVLPAMVVITDQLSVQLGEVVRAAHKASGLTVEEWNGLGGPDREARLQATVEAMRAKPPTPKAAKPKAEAKPKEQKPSSNKEQKPGENKGG